MMKIQKSFHDETKGILYIVPTPIGNLEDITYRALNILKASDVIAAEDTRNTKKLLSYFEIHVPMISYHEHNQITREFGLFERLKKGEKISIVSDAGMPAISDPGEEIVKKAIEEDISVVVLPGANAALCALVGSGLDTKEFTFYGFLPRKKKERKTELARLACLQSTLLFYESPHRLKETLSALLDGVGNRNITLARELTKKFEEYIRGSIEEVIEWVKENQIRGEFVLVVEGKNVSEDSDEYESERNEWESITVKSHVSQIMTDEGVSSKEAIQSVAGIRNMKKRDVYQSYHIEDEN